MDTDQLSLRNLSRPEVRANPYPLYERIQRHDPVHWDETTKTWVVTRYRDVLEALQHRHLSNAKGLDNTFARLPEDARTQAAAIKAFLAKTMLFVDPPYHTRLRGLVNRAFTPALVKRAQPLVTRVVDELLDAMAGKSESDLIADFAYPVPLSVVAYMLGVQAQRHARFKAWSDALVAIIGMPKSSRDIIELAKQSIVELTAYVEGVADEFRRAPNDSLMSALVSAMDEGDRLSADELVANSVLLLLAGHETTTNLIANGIIVLLQHPEELAKLVQSPELIESAVEEILRYESSVQLVVRVATEDVEIGGKTMRKGQVITLLLGAANRDPSQFDDPNRFDISRPPSRHTSFGHGIHYCLGAPLAKLEVPIALGSLIRRFPRLRLADGTVAWRENPTYRGPIALAVHLRG